MRSDLNCTQKGARIMSVFFLKKICFNTACRTEEIFQKLRTKSAKVGLLSLDFLGIWPMPVAGSAAS